MVTVTAKVIAVVVVVVLLAVVIVIVVIAVADFYSIGESTMVKERMGRGWLVGWLIG